ncbi:MAG: hypothetical protein HOP10_07555 [Chitinophagaceae bacterium]|nr:hypothetical protein [Chitinophagaceae bacterium]
MKKVLFLVLLFVISCFYTHGQSITGVWRGKISRQKVELKIIQNGDSLTGTSYYYESANNYRRYSIKGYFDKHTNSAVWWDDRLIEERSGRMSIASPGKIPMLSTADFNCPGGGKMMLDGKAEKKEDRGKPAGDVDLDKTTSSGFEDEWDFVIDNYTVGANDPEIIDSIDLLTKTLPVATPVSNPIAVTDPKTVPVVEKEKKIQPAEKPVQQAAKTKELPVATMTDPVKAPTIEEKFFSREKILIREIPVTGDSIEIRFYDNAEIDGDSISLFLNNDLLFRHIRLTGNAYTIKLAVNTLKETNELTMVAENLGAIPPNTSYMITIVNGQRFEAFLSSTEGSSAMIRLTKKQD